MANLELKLQTIPRRYQDHAHDQIVDGLRARMEGLGSRTPSTITPGVDATNFLKTYQKLPSEIQAADGSKGMHVRRIGDQVIVTSEGLYFKGRPISVLASIPDATPDQATITTSGYTETDRTPQELPSTNKDYPDLRRRVQFAAQRHALAKTLWEADGKPES